MFTIITKIVKSNGTSTGRITLPLSWVGCKVEIKRINKRLLILKRRSPFHYKNNVTWYDEGEQFIITKIKMDPIGDTLVKVALEKYPHLTFDSWWRKEAIFDECFA